MENAEDWTVEELMRDYVDQMTPVTVPVNISIQGQQKSSICPVPKPFSEPPTSSPLENAAAAQNGTNATLRLTFVSASTTKPKKP